MKQHITDEQIHQLDDEQLINLHNYLCKTDRESVITINSNDLGFSGGKSKSVDISSYRKIGVFTTVGKMIEILELNCFYYEIFKQEEEKDTLIIQISKDKRKIGFQGNLCDALWEAVKEVL